MATMSNWPNKHKNGHDSVSLADTDLKFEVVVAESNSH